MAGKDYDQKNKMIQWSDIKESLNNASNKVKGFFKTIYDVVINNEKDFWIIFFLALLTLALTVFFWYKVYNNTNEINQRAMELRNLDKFKATVSLNNSEETRWIKTIDELVDFYTLLKDNETQYNSYIKELATSYEYLLQYIYLPRLNIWKDIYTNKIQTDLIGIKFLQNNPYADTVLVDKRTSFFQDVWETAESNKVVNINIDDFVENENWFFTIPITLSFESSSKRSFLLLLDKLLITSSQENVGLINEFMYYLIQNIKKEKTEEISQISEELKLQFPSNYFANDDGSDNVDKIIGYLIYNRAYSTWEINIIDGLVIGNTVKDIVACEENLDINVCYYRFRDKYRDIPEIAYNIWKLSMDIDKTSYLRKFLKNLPPIISIKNLTFNKTRGDSVMLTEPMKYRWNIIIEVYGKWISDWEVGEIATELWSLCLGTWTVLDSNIAISKIDEYIKKISGISSTDFGRSKNLRELSNILKDIGEQYPNMSNYKKIIKLFEIYRMLNDSNLCEG
jgi:hypothetical protein